MVPGAGDRRRKGRAAAAGTAAANRNREPRDRSALMNGRTRTRAGFSLVELMVVIVILGILATIVTVRVMQHVAKARVEKARIQMSEIMKALDLHKLAEKAYPDSLESLVEATEAHPEGLLQVIPSDPWGNAYEYVNGTEHGYDLVCYGADGQEGGEGDDADLNSWELAGVPASSETTTTTTTSGTGSSPGTSSGTGSGTK
jgi:general secretion pathway protein G